MRHAPDLRVVAGTTVGWVLVLYNVDLLCTLLWGSRICEQRAHVKIQLQIDVMTAFISWE